MAKSKSKSTASKTNAAKMSGAQIRSNLSGLLRRPGPHHQAQRFPLVPEDPTVLLTIAGMAALQTHLFWASDRRMSIEPPPLKSAFAPTTLKMWDAPPGTTPFSRCWATFSFGDYFKRKSHRLGLGTVLRKCSNSRQTAWCQRFREDDDAFAIWRDQIGVPEHRIIRMDEADNFWTSGPTGPCGPCSENLLRLPS